MDIVIKKEELFEWYEFNKNCEHNERVQLHNMCSVKPFTLASCSYQWCIRNKVFESTAARIENKVW